MQKKRFRTLIALCCVLTLFFGLFGGLPTKAKSTNQYKELTFQDWDFNDADMKNTFWKDPVDSLTDLDGVAFTGKVTFRALENADYIVIGAKENAFNAGIRLALLKGDSRGEKFQMVYWDSTGTPHDTFLDSAIYGLDYGTAFKIRMTFEKSGENYKVNTWLNDIACNTELTVPASKLGTKLGIAGTGDNPTTIESVEVDEEPEQKKELTFQDWDFIDADMKNTFWKDPVDSLTDLDGVAFTGKVTFRALENADYIVIGAKENAFNAGIRLALLKGDSRGEKFQMVYWDSTGTPHDTFLDSATYGLDYGTAFKIRMTFEKSGENYKVNTWLNDIACNTELTVPASKLGTKLGIAGTGDNPTTIESVEVDEEPEQKKELTFQDWDFNDADMKNTFWKDPVDSLTDLDGVAFTGKVTFRALENADYIVIGAKENTFNAGIRLALLKGDSRGEKFQMVYWDSTGTPHDTFLDSAAYGLDYGTAFKIRMTFEKSGENYKVNTWLNDIACNTELTVPASKLGTKLGIAGTGDNPTTIESVQVGEEPEPTITEYSFEDFGYENPTMLNANKTSQNSTTSPADSWDKVCLKETLTFGQSVDDFGKTGIRIGSNTNSGGLFLGVVNGAFWIWNETGATGTSGAIGAIKAASLEELGSTEWAETKIQVSLTFEYVENNVRITASIDNRLSDKEAVVELVDCADKLSMDITAYANVGTLQIGDKEPEPEPTPATTFTFKDYGIEDGVYSEQLGTRAEVYMLKNAPENLDGYVFKGNIKFASTDAHWIRYIKIGAVENTYNANFDVESGVQVIQLADGTVQFNCKTSDGVKTVEFNGLEVEESIPVSVEFRYKKNESILVTVSAGNQEAKEMVLPAGTRLGTNLHIRADLWVEIQSYDPNPEPEPEPTPATAFTFKDYGIEDGVYSEQLGTRAEVYMLKNAPENLDGYVFKGNIKFASTDAHWIRYIKIGAIENTYNANFDVESGIQVVQLADGTVQFNCKTPSDVKTVEFQGLKVEESIPVSVEFRYKKNGSILVTVSAGEQEAKEMVLPAGTSLGTNLHIRSDVWVEIQSYDPNPEPEPEEKPYKTISFENYGIKYGTFSEQGGTRAQVLKMKNAPSTLDGYLFNGYVKYTETEAPWIRYVKIGTAENTYNENFDVISGIQVIQLVDGTIKFSCETPVGEKNAEFKGFKCDEYVAISVAFRYKKSGNIIVTVSAGNKAAKTMELPKGTVLGTNLHIRSDVALSVVTGSMTPDQVPLSLEEAWKKFLGSKVDLGLFGFSNQTWKRDLADICR